MKENEFSNIIKPGFETLDEVLKSLEKSQSASSMGYSSKQTFYSSSIIDENASLSEASYIRHSTPKSRSTCSNRVINEDSSVNDEDAKYDSDSKIDDNDFKQLIGRIFTNSNNSQNRNQIDDLESMSSSCKSKYKKAVSFNLLPEDLDETYIGGDELESDLSISRSYKILDKLTDELNNTHDKTNNKQSENEFFNNHLNTSRQIGQIGSFSVEDLNRIFDEKTEKQSEKVFLYDFVYPENKQSPQKFEPSINERFLNEKTENQQFNDNSEIFLDKLADCINKKNAINMSYIKIQKDLGKSNLQETNGFKFNSVDDLDHINNFSKNEKFHSQEMQINESGILSNGYPKSFQSINSKEINDILRLKDSYLRKQTESYLDEKDLSIDSIISRTCSSSNLSPKSVIGITNSKSETLFSRLNSSVLKSPTLKEDYMSLNFLPARVNFETNSNELKKPLFNHNIKGSYSDEILKEKLNNIFSEIRGEKTYDNNFRKILAESPEKTFSFNSNIYVDEQLTSKYNLDKFLLKDFPSASSEQYFDENQEKSKKVTFKLSKPVQALNIKKDIEEGLKKNLKPVGYGLLIMDLSKLAEKNVNVNNRNLILNKSKKFILKNVPIFKKDVESYSPIKRIEIYS